MKGNTAPACTDQKAYAAANVMDFFMGPNSYEGPTLCAWFAPANRDGNHPKLEPIDLCDLIDLVAHDDWVADLVSDAICYAPALGDIKIAAQNGKSPGEYFEKVALIENEARDSEIDLATTRKVIDRLLAEAQALLKIEQAAVMEHYRQATARLMEKLNAPLPSEIQSELDEFFRTKSKPSKPKGDRPAVYRAIDKAMKGMPREIGALDLNTKCNGIVKHSQFDAGAKEYLIEQIAANTHRGKRAARKAVNESVAAMREKNKPKPGKDSIPVVNEWGEPQMAQWAEERMESKKVDGIPAVFGFEGDVCHERNGKREMLSERQFAAIINDNTEWAYAKSDGQSGSAKRAVFAPDKVVGHMFHRQPKPYPELANVATAPYFAPNGRLVIEESYDAETQTLLQLNGLNVKRVSATPSEEEVRESLRLIFEEAFGDFPIGGMNRDGIVKSLVDAEGEANPDAAHLLAMLLQPFCIWSRSWTGTPARFWPGASRTRWRQTSASKR